MSDNGPVGVFDSGVGGLTVLRWIRSVLPNENLLYIADSRYAPYGEKSQAFIEQRTVALTEYLLDKKAKAVVVACNTATVAAIKGLRERFDIPIIGIEPGVKPALSISKKGIVGVLATSNTVASTSFAQLIERFADGRKVEIQACPGLVEQVEKLDLTGLTTRALLDEYLSRLLDKGVDTIVLGCTHYPFLLSLVKERVGDNVEVVDTGEAVAREVSRRLREANLLTSCSSEGREMFWTSNDKGNTENAIKALWHSSAVVGILNEL